MRPGNYYVVVEKSGYIKPRDMFTAKRNCRPFKGNEDGIVEAALPRVKVEANQTERAEVRMERGAAISGTVRFDDGSPAAELEVELLHRDAKGKWIAVHDQEHPHLGGNVETDDRGYFRIASLLPDEYLVKVMMRLSDTKLSRNGEGDNETMYAYFVGRFELPFYGAGVARQKDATTAKVNAGQELTGQDMLLPIQKLRHVTGRVAAGADAHIVNAAKVSMVTRDDNVELASTKLSREDSLFHFDFVPDGDYVLKVTEVRDVAFDPIRPDPKGDPFAALKPQDKERTLQQYGNADLPLLLDGSRDGITVTVPRDAKPPKAMADQQAAN